MTKTKPARCIAQGPARVPKGQDWLPHRLHQPPDRLVQPPPKAQPLPGSQVVHVGDGVGVNADGEFDAG